MLRMGGRTDLPLSSSGCAQAVKLGAHLLANYPTPKALYVSPLLRTRQTAEAITKAYNANIAVHVDSRFREIDYGPDEGKPETEVVARLGQAALKAWEEQALVPAGWLADVDNICTNWREFALQLLQEYCAEDYVCVVSSQGILRFAGCILENNPQGRIATGAYCHLHYNGVSWQILTWNQRP